MSCDAVAFSAMLWLASTSPVTAPGPVASVASAPQSVAGEPLFSDIVRRAGTLKANAEVWRRSSLDGAAAGLAGFAAFKAALGELAAMDMKGHVLLAARGTDGDLKCILKGISQDLPLKFHDLELAATPKARAQAIQELTYLLNDNVEVITAPPTPAA